MTRSGIFTADIFRLADLCIEAGFFSGLEDQRYALLLVWSGKDHAEIHRAQVNCILPTPCRVWLVKGQKCLLLGDSASLPADLSAGIGPPYVG